MKATDFSDLKVGDQAEIIGYNQGDPAYRSRILAFGLLKGTRFKLAKTAPGGDPIEIRLRGYSLTLRRKEADILQIRILKD